MVTLEAFIKDTKAISVKAAGQLPNKEFSNPKTYTKVRNILALTKWTVYGASDAG